MGFSVNYCFPLCRILFSGDFPSTTITFMLTRPLFFNFGSDLIKTTIVLCNSQWKKYRKDMWLVYTTSLCRICFSEDLSHLSNHKCIFSNTLVGAFPCFGISKQPLYLPHNCSETSLHRQSRWRTNPQGVSQINSGGGYFKERYKSAASLTDSWRVRNFDATVI